MSSLWARFLDFLRALPLPRPGGTSYRWVEPSSELTRLIFAGPVALPRFDVISVAAVALDTPVAAEVMAAAKVIEQAAAEPAAAQVVDESATAEPDAASDPIPFPGRAA